jgi:hypothetical protein
VTSNQPAGRLRSIRQRRGPGAGKQKLAGATTIARWPQAAASAAARVRAARSPSCQPNRAQGAEPAKGSKPAARLAGVCCARVVGLPVCPVPRAGAAGGGWLVESR